MFIIATHIQDHMTVTDQQPMLIIEIQISTGEAQCQCGHYTLENRRSKLAVRGRANRAS